MLKRIIIFLGLFSSLLFSGIIYSETVRISQVDTSRLLFSQDVNLYVSVTNDSNQPIKGLTENKFNIFESTDNRNFSKINDIVAFKEQANAEAGINFLFLIDNSGSMYDDINGKATDNEQNMKIGHVKSAIRSLLDNITNKKDKISFAVFNSYYNTLVEPVADKELISKTLDNITRPVGDEGWTELYSSIYLAIDNFSKIKGRKAIIVLTDGMNEPYYLNTGKEHKIFKTKIFKYNEPVLESQKQGISIFAINFSRPEEAKDQGLSLIANESGGMTFNAYNPEELNSVYRKIQELILNEYLITYKATMAPSEKKFVKVRLNNNKSIENTRIYFSSTLFGEPLKVLNPLILLVFLVALLLLWLLTLIKFKKDNKDAVLEVLSTQVGTKVLNKNITLTKGKTLIGGSQNSDMTIVGAHGTKDNYATILYDDAKDKYTLVSDGDLTVNNKPVKTKTLEAGDVINTGSATIVFDDKILKKKK